jgi:AhpD family alkylhydroperoxidase
MRLKPIENPKNMFVKIAYWFTKRQYGKVITPLKVIYSRKPKLLRFAMKIDTFERQQTSLAPDLRLFIKIAAATQNGCTFCQDIGLAQAVKGKIGTEKFVALVNGKDSVVFNEQERAVLNFIRQYATEKRVSDENFAALQKHFDDTNIVEILALNAFEQFFNAMAIPLEIHSDGLQKLAEKKLTA